MERLMCFIGLIVMTTQSVAALHFAITGKKITGEHDLGNDWTGRPIDPKKERESALAWGFISAFLAVMALGCIIWPVRY